MTNGHWMNCFLNRHSLVTYKKLIMLEAGQCRRAYVMKLRNGTGNKNSQQHKQDIIWHSFEPEDVCSIKFHPAGKLALTRRTGIVENGWEWRFRAASSMLKSFRSGGLEQCSRHHNPACGQKPLKYPCATLTQQSDAPPPLPPLWCDVSFFVAATSGH